MSTKYANGTILILFYTLFIKWSTNKYVLLKIFFISQTNLILLHTGLFVRLTKFLQNENSSFLCEAFLDVVQSNEKLKFKTFKIQINV
jgi:hypothetical protein